MYALFATSGQLCLQLLVADVCLPDVAILYGDDVRATTFHEIECQAVGYATEPCAERCLLCIVAVDSAESPQEGVLRQFLGIHHVCYEPRNHGKDLLSVATDHQVLPLALAVFYSFHYLLVCLHFQCFLLLFYLLYDRKKKTSRSSRNFFKLFSSLMVNVQG